jgi:hypothetical protein
MNEIQQQIIAIQLIQELIVDMCNDAGVFNRAEFESKLKDRTIEFNDKIKEYMDNQKKENVIYMPNIIGEA